MKNALKVIIFIVAVLALCAGGIFGYTKYMKTDFDFSDGTKSGTVEITAYNGDSVNIIIPKKNTRQNGCSNCTVCFCKNRHHIRRDTRYRYFCRRKSFCKLRKT